MSGCHLFDAYDVKPQTDQTIRNILSWSVFWKVTNNGFDGFF
jgi:hypothetical protein